MIAKLLAIIVPLVILEPRDSPTYAVPFARTDTGGLVSLIYTPLRQTGPTRGFLHWAKGDPICCRSFYVDGYDDARLGLVLQRGHFVLAHRITAGRVTYAPPVYQPVTFTIGRPTWLVWFWRRLPGDRLEMGCYKDGALVSWALVAGGDALELWPAPVRIGSRDDHIAHPEKHEIEGRIDALEILALRQGAVRRRA